LATWLLVIDLFLLVRNLFSVYQEYSGLFVANIDQNYAIVRLFVLGIVLITLEAEMWLQFGLFISLLIFGLELVNEFQKTAAIESQIRTRNNVNNVNGHYSEDSYNTPQKFN